MNVRILKRGLARIGLVSMVVLSCAFGGAWGASAWDSVIAAAKKDGSVTVYSVFPIAIENSLYGRFHETYGITVNNVHVGGSVPTVKKFLTEAQAGQSVADVMVIWKTAALPLRNQNLVAKLDLPNGAAAMPQFSNNDGFFYVPFVEAMPIIYNANLISQADLPKEYKDLSDPKYRGKLISGVPENSANWIEIIEAWRELYGWDWIKAYAANHVLENVTEIQAAELMSRGERALGVMSQSAPAAQIAAGAPLGFDWLRPIIVGQYAIVVPARAPHPNAARAMANMILSKDFQAAWATQIGTFSVLPDVAPRAGFPPLTALRVYVANLTTVINDGGKIVDQYRQIMNAAK